MVRFGVGCCYCCWWEWSRICSMSIPVVVDAVAVSRPDVGRQCRLWLVWSKLGRSTLAAAVIVVESRCGAGRGCWVEAKGSPSPMCGGTGLVGPRFVGCVHPHSLVGVFGGLGWCEAAAPSAVVGCRWSWRLAVGAQGCCRCWLVGPTLGLAAVARGWGGPRRRRAFPPRAAVFGKCAPWSRAAAPFLGGRVS